MTQEVTCNKCESAQITVQKKGFSGRKSFAGFIGMAVFVIIIWAVLIHGQNMQNELDNEMEKIDHLHEIMNKTDGRVYTPLDYTENKALWLATAFILAASFLIGFVGANKNQIVCLKCGNIQPIGENKETGS